MDLTPLPINGWPTQFEELAEDLLDTVNRLTAKFKLTDEAIKEGYFRVFGQVSPEFKSDAERLMTLVDEMDNRWRSIRDADTSLGQAAPLIGRPPTWMRSARNIYVNSKKITQLSDQLIELNVGKWNGRLFAKFNLELKPCLKEILEAIGKVEVTWSVRYRKLKQYLAAEAVSDQRGLFK